MLTVIKFSVRGFSWMHGNWPCTVLFKILSKNPFDDNVYAPQNMYIVYSHTITLIFCICQLPVRFLEQQMCVNRPCFVFSSFSKNTLDKTVLQLKLDIHPFSWHKAWVNTFLFLTTISVWWSGKGREQTGPLSHLTNICGVGRGVGRWTLGPLNPSLTTPSPLSSLP